MHLEGPRRLLDPTAGTIASAQQQTCQGFRIIPPGRGWAFDAIGDRVHISQLKDHFQVQVAGRASIEEGGAQRPIRSTGVTTVFRNQIPEIREESHRPGIGVHQRQIVPDGNP